MLGLLVAAVVCIRQNDGIKTARIRGGVRRERGKCKFFCPMLAAAEAVAVGCPRREAVKPERVGAALLLDMDGETVYADRAGGLACRAGFRLHKLLRAVRRIGRPVCQKT